MNQHPHIGYFIPGRAGSPHFDGTLTPQPPALPPPGFRLGHRKLDVDANSDCPATRNRHIAEQSFAHLGQFAISGVHRPVDHHLANPAGEFCK